MSRYQELLTFIKIVRPYIRDIGVYALEVEHGGELVVNVRFMEGMYPACKAFEPWEPQRGYLDAEPSLKWEIIVKDVLRVRPVKKEEMFMWSSWLGRIQAEMQV